MRSFCATLYIHVILSHCDV